MCKRKFILYIDLITYYILGYSRRNANHPRDLHEKEGKYLSLIILN